VQVLEDFFRFVAYKSRVVCVFVMKGELVRWASQRFILSGERASHVRFAVLN